MRMQSAIAMIYPHHCATCDTAVDQHGGLCGPCWRDTPFIHGLACNKCGAPLPGEDDQALHCDDCMRIARPWSRGLAATIYRDNARKLVLQIKHADRLDMVPAAAGWMAKKALPLCAPDSVVVPVPVHWTRLLRRRFNQAAMLSAAMARNLGLEHAPRALLRVKQTTVQDGKTVDARFADLRDSMVPNPRFSGILRGRPALLVDDVMTSGATLAAATEAAMRAGASRVDVVTLARVVKDA
ncbi:ComF family protein [Maribius pontilimi]|uniref:ComF family protein n=1 Tax=Palleronia pontilimi TaxID=1964209 RepID=A0A934IEU9_9RHOB|nr:double zinc ribbon domain-containing protein [Palleronia pontilimi]MBJ3761578.1 ComF family protein [Palleronia pontilimi]